MFDPKNSIIIQNIWNALGTFYGKLPEESKAIIEHYWSSLFNGIEGLYYDKGQVISQENFLENPGFIEDSYKQYLIDPNTLTRFGQNRYGIILNNNYFAAPVLSGLYTETSLYENTDYVLSGLNTIIFTDNNKLRTLLGDVGNSDIASLPYYNSITGYDTITFTHVSGVNSFEDYLETKELYRNVHYAISGTSVNFITADGLKNVLQYESEILFLNSALRVPAIIQNFYLPNLDIDDTQSLYNVVIARKYAPSLTAYNAETAFNKTKMYAAHLSHFCNAAQYYRLKGPTLVNIKNSLNLLYNIPFSYNSGQVKAVYKTATGSTVLIEHARKFLSKDWALIKQYNVSNTVEILPSLVADLTTETYDYSTNTVIVSGVLSYFINSGLNVIVTSGQSVSRFQFLASGVQVEDYISNYPLVSGVTDFANNPEELYSILYLNKTSQLNDLNNYSNFITFYKESIIPNGLNIKDLTTLSYVYDDLYTDAALLDFFSAVPDLTYTQKDALNNLILDLKSYGYWDSIVALYPMIGDSESDLSYNIKNTAAYQITWHNSPVITESGVSFNGVDSYGHIPIPRNIASTNLGMFVYALGNISNSPVFEGTGLLGSFDSSLDTGIYKSQTTGKFIFYNNSINDTVNDFSVTVSSKGPGLLGTYRQDSSNISIYVNDSETVVSNPVGTLTTTEFAIGEVKTSGSVAGHPAAYTNALTLFTNAEIDITTLNNIITRYETALGRAI